MTLKIVTTRASSTAFDAADGKRTNMPYIVRETDGQYQVVDRETGKVHSRHTSKEKAERQRRLLEGIRHGWKPTGKKGDGS
jgi:phage gp16-like protein